VSGSILSLYFIPKPSPSSVALPLLPAPIFFVAGRASGPKNGFQTDPTISLSLPNRLSDLTFARGCVVCARIFFSSFFLSDFFFFLFSLSHSSIFVQFRIYMATTTVWVGFRLSLFSSSHFAKSPDRSHAAAPQIQKQIRLFFFLFPEYK
jgi:hypothetical protein